MKAEIEKPNPDTIDHVVDRFTAEKEIEAARLLMMPYKVSQKKDTPENFSVSIDTGGNLTKFKSKVSQIQAWQMDGEDTEVSYCSNLFASLEELECSETCQPGHLLRKYLRQHMDWLTTLGWSISDKVPPQCLYRVKNQTKDGD